MKRVSVCMATYNGSRFVHRQVESILEQLSQDDELIVADDGSTDETLGIIRQFADSRIRILEPKRLGSAIRTFERALVPAQGHYIFLADQDDEWLPGKLTHMLAQLQEADLVLSDCRVVDLQGLVIHPSFFAHRQSAPGLFRNLWKNPYMGCCMAFRSSLLEKALPFPAHIHMHDWWIGLVAERYGNVAFLNQTLLKYVRHGENVSPTGQGRYSWSKRFMNRFWMAWYVLTR